MAVWSIVQLKVLSNYKIAVSFADGTTGTAIDLAPDAMYQRIRESGTATFAAKSRKLA